jgi:hypothetical protein
MSPSGQKQTCALRNVISALPPIATSIAFFGGDRARQKYEPCDSSGGKEWIKARVETVLDVLKKEWGEPDFLRA